MPELTYSGKHPYMAHGMKRAAMPGDTVKVSESEASRLMRQFPGVWAVAGTPEAPTADRAVKPPKRRKPKAKK